MRPKLGPNDIHVWYRLTDSIDKQQLCAAVSLLSPAERARHDRFVYAHLRREYAVAHALLRSSLSIYTSAPPDAWTFEESGLGKPALARLSGLAPNLSFNLTHTRGLVACAIAETADLGIDAEYVDRVVDEQAIARRYFASGEVAQLERCSSGQRTMRFFELWTLKEAYLKGTGRGLVTPLSVMSFTLGNSGRIGVTPSTRIDARVWQFALFAPGLSHRIAVAIACKGTQAWQITARSSEDDSETAAMASSISKP